MNELRHHGVKGMKWGVRRYQNYDGTRIGSKRKSGKSHHTIKKGSRVYRATTTNNESFMNRKYTYVNVTDSYSDHNINTSEGFSRRFDYDYVMETKKNLKIASLDDYFDAVMESNNIDKDLYLRDVDSKVKKKGEYAVMNLLPHNLREGDGGKYSAMNNAVKYLSKKGYDGVIDPVDGANQIKRNENPMSTIIFDPKQNLKVKDIYNR